MTCNFEPTLSIFIFIVKLAADSADKSRLPLRLLSTFLHRKAGHVTLELGISGDLPVTAAQEILRVETHFDPIAEISRDLQRKDYTIDYNRTIAEYIEYTMNINEPFPQTARIMPIIPVISADLCGLLLSRSWQTGNPVIRRLQPRGRSNPQRLSSQIAGIAYLSLFHIILDSHTHILILYIYNIYMI